jgi:hypothetical protein
MKYIGAMLAFFPILFFDGMNARAQAPNVSQVILTADSLFWEAYNKCDVAGMSQFFTSDVEFYHDRGGLTQGLENFVAALKKGLCGNDESRLRREAVRESVSVFPMQNAGAVYAAIISGQHVFYIVEKGKEPRLDGKARFTHLWLLDESGWKMSRVLSYDHGPADYVNKRKIADVPMKMLSRFVGNYTGSKFGSGKVEMSDGHLALIVGGERYHLFPESNSIFFVRERDLTFEFVSDEKGRVSKMVIRENGNVVDEFIKS